MVKLRSHVCLGVGGEVAAKVAGGLAPHVGPQLQPRYRHEGGDRRYKRVQCTSRTSRTSVSNIVTQQHPEQQEVRLSDGLLHVAGEVVLYGGLDLTYKSSNHPVDCGVGGSFLWFS